MLSSLSDIRPIQVFLDTSSLIGPVKPSRKGGGAKDFFEGDDRGFAEHKEKILTRLNDVATILREKRQPCGFIRVRQRDSALAKSHRPIGALFIQKKFPFVGADRVGEMIFQATSTDLEDLARRIEVKAELTPRMVNDPKTGKMKPRVTAYRSELGGIDDVVLYDSSDRLKFSVDEALQWMSHPNVVGGYIVELFRAERDNHLVPVMRMLLQLKNGLENFSGGIIVRPFLPTSHANVFGDPPLAISIRLTTGYTRSVALPFADDAKIINVEETALSERSPDVNPNIGSDLAISRHDELLDFLASQPLVRSIELPPIIDLIQPTSTKLPLTVTVPPPADNGSYPVVAIIDGGVTNAPCLRPWKVGDAGTVLQDHRDESHGTFIAGLVTAGRLLNPELSHLIETRGCKIYDLDFFPRLGFLHDYYQDVDELFDLLEEKIKVAKRNHNVRVFNLSYAIGTRESHLAYSIYADRLDRIARANDVIFVVSAGNIRTNPRQAWPERSDDALAMLATYTNDDQYISSPAEHLLGLTVGAVNPLGVDGHIPLMPTTYTRRGPGVGGARKPDLAHLGGVSSNPSGLASLNPSGEVIHNRGTSFASPLTAATLATLDHHLAGCAAREVLISLPVHRAKRPALLDCAKLRHVVRDFVGFGMTPPADEILSDNPYSITIVFREELPKNQSLEFPFSWPSSLVNDDGSCRGQATLTLCFSPPIDLDHGEEAIRVQLDANLHQEKVNEENGTSKWEPRMVADGGEMITRASRNESHLIRSGLKWSPIKKYHMTIPQGRGNTSNWKVTVTSLVRAGAPYPVDGVPFCLVLTITDPAAQSPVREEMRQHLISQGYQLADITVAHQIRPRVG